MCGHVGIAGKLEFKDEATMKKLLVFDFFRGPDSTGFAALRNNGEVKIAKVASVPTDLFDMKKFTDALSGYNSTVFMGHNRLATKGGVNNHNAHPWEFPKPEGGSIIGCHNGTLDVACWHELEDLLGEKFGVDSMALIAAIARLGIEAVVPVLRGAWALVWIDTSDNSLNFLRNKERPFWYSYTKEFNRLFWASEYWMIEAAVKAAGHYELYKTQEGYQFFATKEDWWYRYDLDKLKAGAEARPKPRIKELKGKEPLPAQTHACGGTSPFPRRTQTHLTKTTSMTTSHGSTGGVTTHTTGTSSNSNSSKGDKDNVFPLLVHGTRTSPFGDYISREEFDKLAKYGCSWCQADVEFDEPGVQVFKDRDMILCPDCAGGGETNRIYLAG